MELEQLVSAVRYMRAQKQALDYLDEALTRVMDIEQVIQGKQKEIQQLDETIAQKMQELIRVESEQRQCVTESKTEQDRYREKMLAELDQKRIEHERAIQASTESVAVLTEQQQALVLSCERLQSEAAQLRHAKDVAEQELAGVQQAMADLKARL